MSQCINLKESYGQQYQVSYEESYRAERGDGGRLKDPWLQIIPCRFGHLYPHGGNYLGASTTRRGPVANRLAALPCVRLVQDGDDGVNVVFHLDDFELVAAVMRPKRRRRLPADRRAEQVERLRNYQFRPATHDARNDRRRDATVGTDAQVV